MAVYGYVRTPMSFLGEEGDSLETQIRAIEEYARREGLAVERIFTEWKASHGKALEGRPQGKRLLAALRKGDMVVACNMDRMFRSAREALLVLNDFQREGVALVLLDMGGEITRDDKAQQVVALLSAAARLERERDQKHMETVKSKLHQRGRHLGGTTQPFGYAVDRAGRVAPVEAEQAIIQEILALRECGLSCERIAEALRRKGFVLSAPGVRCIIRENQESQNAPFPERLERYRNPPEEADPRQRMQQRALENDLGPRRPGASRDGAAAGVSAPSGQAAS